MLEAIAQKVDRSAVRHPNGEKVARSFADRPGSNRGEGAGGKEGPEGGDRAMASGVCQGSAWIQVVQCWLLAGTQWGQYSHK